MFKKDFTAFIYCLLSYFGSGLYYHQFNIDYILMKKMFTVVCTYNVHVSQDGPIVKGATITFNATVYYGNEVVTNEHLKYMWEDNGIPQHKKTVSIPSTKSKYVVILGN